jgi:hypothetical protein
MPNYINEITESIVSSPIISILSPPTDDDTSYIQKTPEETKNISISPPIIPVISHAIEASHNTGQENSLQEKCFLTSRSQKKRKQTNVKNTKCVVRATEYVCGLCGQLKVCVI